MNHNERLLSLVEKGIELMDSTMTEGKKMDVKSLKDCAATMKTLAELSRELKAEQMMIEPITVIMGESEKYAD